MLMERGRSAGLRMLRVWSDLIAVVCLLIAVGTCLSIDQTYSGFLVVLGSTLAGFAYLIACAISFLRWMALFRWSRACVAAIKAGAFVLLVGPCLRSGDYLHLLLFYPVYRQQIDARGGESTEPSRFFWGDKALWVTDGLQADTLVYDPTDALARTVDEVRDSDQAGLGLTTRHLIGHFYVEREFSR